LKVSSECSGLRSIHAIKYWLSPVPVVTGIGRKNSKSPAFDIPLLRLVRLVIMKHFTVSEVAADWHELMIAQRTIWVDAGPAVQPTGKKIIHQNFT